MTEMTEQEKNDEAKRVFFDTVDKAYQQGIKDGIEAAYTGVKAAATACTAPMQKIGLDAAVKILEEFKKEDRW